MQTKNETFKNTFIPNTYEDPRGPLTCERGQVGLCHGFCSYLFHPDRERRFAHPEWRDVLLDSIRCGDVETVKMCLEAGACSKDDQQALVIAIEESSAAVAVLLVNYGIDPFFRDKPDFWHYSFTPVEIVAEFIRDGSEPCHDDMEQIMAAIRQKWPDRFMDWWCGQNKGV